MPLLPPVILACWPVHLRGPAWILCSIILSFFNRRGQGHLALAFPMKIDLDTIGCLLNQSEIETMARQFRFTGHEVVSTPELAEMPVVNTFAVTPDAASSFRAWLRT